jgi:putative ABC transport system substrate-binding protein
VKPPLLFLACLIWLVTMCQLAAAEAPRLPARIGELWGDATESGAEPYRQQYLEGMRSLGWIDGRTAQFLVRYDGGDISRLPALARELIDLGIDVLVVNGRALPAARRATTTLPIVSLDMWDPVAEGVTSSLAKPDRNVTGVSWQTIDTAGKRLELAKELLPGLRRVGLLTDPGDPGAVIEAKGLRSIAAAAGVKLRIFEVRHPREFRAAFATINNARTEALIVSTSTLTIHHLARIVRFASSRRLPTISEAAEFADAGVLLTYGPDMSETYKRGALQVDKILKGAKPGELPFEQPTRFELVINLNTSKALGLTIPESIMIRATRLIRSPVP